MGFAVQYGVVSRLSQGSTRESRCDSDTGKLKACAASADRAGPERA
jgi:hypothetical protein